MDQMRTWCRLPREILSLIVSRLLAGDIVAFHAVCKWWSETPSPITPLMLPPSVGSFHSEPPFLLLPNKKLFHPIYKYSHYTRIYDLPKGVFRASHCGWLLMTRYEMCIFFYNPYTNEKIDLPDMPFNYYWPNVTFSSPPTSPDCLVFGVQEDPIGNENLMNVFTIKPGQENWNRNTFHSRSYFKLSSCNPIMFKDLYYCLGKDGSLLIYDTLRKKPRWVGPPEPSLQGSRSIFGCMYYMVESQGKLLLVFTDREGNSVNVGRYTRKRSMWEKVDDLGDTTLFVSQVTSFSAKSVVRGTRNKIYFPNFVGGTDNQLFYSLDTRKYHCFLGDRSWKKIHEASSWKNFHQTKSRSHANSAWIKPYISS